MKLLAISGGPDSMFLLDWYKNKKVVVAHINYHKREDSNVDENIVKDFCKKNKIPFEILNVKEKPKGNFQSWARKVRYDFFAEVYKKYNCNEILLAHHKDDFLETAIMQQESGRTPKYFGIKKKNVINGMKIHRPFIHLYWKEEILNELNKANISFATDSSNDQPIFERNRVRLTLKKKTKNEKNKMFAWFKMSNKILKKKNKRIDKAYARWEATGFDCKHISKSIYKNELIYDFVHNNFTNIKLSKGKIESLLQFIEGTEGGKNFMLNSKTTITKKKGKLII